MCGWITALSKGNVRHLCLMVACVRDESELFAHKKSPEGVLFCMKSERITYEISARESLV